MLRVLRTSRVAGVCPSSEYHEPASPQAIAKLLKKSLCESKDTPGLESEMTNQQLVSAYDRMRTRKFARMLSEGKKASVAAVVAEREAAESLATLARNKGIGSVVVATKGAIVNRKSCVNRMLKRRSIRTAAMSEISGTITRSREETKATVRHSTSHSRTRLRRRASLLLLESRERASDVDDDHSSGDEVDDSKLSPGHSDSEHSFVGELS